MAFISPWFVGSQQRSTVSYASAMVSCVVLSTILQPNGEGNGVAREVAVKASNDFMHVSSLGRGDLDMIFLFQDRQTRLRPPVAPFASLPKNKVLKQPTTNQRSVAVIRITPGEEENV